MNIKWKSNKIIMTGAFTLSEVLITLGIIGIVAALIIPAVMQNTQEQEYKTAYRKAYSVASQAWLEAYSEGNLTLCTQWNDSGTVTCNADNFDAFKNEMKIMKDCGTDTASCWNMTGEKSWAGASPYSNAQAFTDLSGMTWAKCSSNPAAELLVDTNGSKPPNQYGKDRAIFILYYGSASGIPSKYLNQPIVALNSDYTSASVGDTEATYRCPSLATHPCYYTSWITGAH